MQTRSVTDQTPFNPFATAIQLWRDLKLVAGPYWYPTEVGTRAFSEVIYSWGMFILLLILITSVVGINSLSSFWNRYVFDIVIEEKNLEKYLGTLWISVLFIVVTVLLVAFSKYIRKKIAMDWYKWLNNHILTKYLSNQAYYKINFKSKITNPDQRIAQEIEPITINALRFSTTFIEKLMDMIAAVIILWTISSQVAIYLIVYTIVGNILAIFLSQELAKINREELAFKADFNYCLTHVRNHAESIAFFQGETEELNIIKRRFENVLKNSERRLNWERGQDIFNSAYQSAISLFSMFTLTPLFIQDQINYGEISQATFCSFMFSNALGVLIAEFGNSGRFSSYVQRLAEFSDALASVSKKPENLGTFGTIKVLEEPRLGFEDFTLK
ncbi:MAG: ABC transporter transmembrane domain-containing protein, partial [Sphaerospermopsis kisseleviana]